MTVSVALNQRVRKTAGNRCGYCQSAQKYVLGLLEIEHIIPSAQGGTDDEENLWLACRLCNSYKGVQIAAIDPESEKQAPLFNPRQQVWLKHFCWSSSGERIEGITACGRATIVALKLNNPIAITVRNAWISAGWHPPK